jgi:hypothetical protein
MLQQEFPGLRFVVLPSYSPRYQKHGPMMPTLAVQLSHWRQVIRAEREVLDDFLDDAPHDAIISDNRYGLRSPHIPSVLVTHQLRFMLHPRPVRTLANLALHRLIERFDEVWIPDLEDADASLGGNMSHAPMNVHTRFIGFLSRFESVTHQSDSEYKVLAILSGPEPQRTLLERVLLRQLPNLTSKTLLVRGLPGSTQATTEGLLTIRNHLPAVVLAAIIGGAELVISRAGYSTIMDLLYLRKRALLVPTPGQPEQGYLTKQLMDRNWFLFRSQRQLDLPTAMRQISQLNNPLPEVTSSFEGAISSLLDRLQPSRSNQIGAYSSVMSSP